MIEGIGNPFQTVRCPKCNTIMDMTNLKYSDGTDSTIVESYVCDCGTRFTVEMRISESE